EDPLRQDHASRPQGRRARSRDGRPVDTRRVGNREQRKTKRRAWVAKAARSHRDLVVWQKAMDLVEEVYRLSGQFPAEERFRLSSQITRAAISVPSNIAEGNARGSRNDYVRFLSNAKGSLMETETQVLLAVRLGYVNEASAEPALNLIVEISKMLTAMRNRLLDENLLSSTVPCSLLPIPQASPARSRRPACSCGRRRG